MAHNDLIGSIFDYFLTAPLAILSAILALVVTYHVSEYFRDPHGLRKYPGPPLAAFSDLWLIYHARICKRYEAVDAAHRKYGKYVRIAPNHLSIADAEALDTVYGHGTGTLKPVFYDAFVGFANIRGLFNSRDRAQHSRKRKIVSHTFSQRNVIEFEPYIASLLRAFIGKWDKHCEEAKKEGRGWWEFDSLPWFNYLAFDIIGDLAFGRPFGMIEREADIAKIEADDGSISYQSAVLILNERGEYSACLGVIPPWARGLTKRTLPWFRRGKQSVINLAGMAKAAVRKRLEEGGGDRKDLLTRLQEGRDENGNPMGKEELTAEALTQLIAGSDTTSNSSCAITFFITKHPEVQKKLQAELDNAFKGFSGGVLEYEDVKNLPYLDACINEALRRHSTSSIGLPREITEESSFKGEPLLPGTICSVPSYTIHHQDAVWNEPFAYKPERWLDPEENKRLNKHFVPFSVGPRSCVGRNLASMELLIFIATLFYRYEFKLCEPTASMDELETKEGFLRKPLACQLGIRRRTPAVSS